MNLEKNLLTCLHFEGRGSGGRRWTTGRCRGIRKWGVGSVLSMVNKESDSASLTVLETVLRKSRKMHCETVAFQFVFFFQSSTTHFSRLSSLLLGKLTSLVFCRKRWSKLSLSFFAIFY